MLKKELEVVLQPISVEENNAGIIFKPEPSVGDVLTTSILTTALSPMIVGTAMATTAEELSRGVVTAITDAVDSIKAQNTPAP